jgi:hypothetical protein
MKIYVLSYESPINKLLGVYAKIEKAKEKLIEEKKKIQEQLGDIYYLTKETENSFEIYKMGEGGFNHASVFIKEMELDFDFRIEYWKEVAQSHLESIQTDLEGAYSNLSDEEVDKILERSADEFINDDNVWDVIDETLHRIVEDNAQDAVEGGE